MEDQVARLVDKAWDRYLQTPEDRRFMIAIGGIPGSGKTTLSRLVTARLNERHAARRPADSAQPVAAFVPMDGYHLTRAQLAAQPDAAGAFARRGAAFTFDGAAFARLVQALRAPPTAVVYAPSFDHAAKDPVADDIAVAPAQRIVVFEGNYCTLDREPWRRAAALMDERWFVDAPLDVARRRLVARHVAAGISPDAADAERRVADNDLPNAEQIVRERLPVDEVVVSREDNEWRHG